MRREAEAQIEIEARAKGRHGVAWQYMKQNIKALSVRQRLNMIFHAKNKILDKLHSDYDVRNEAGHNYKMLPGEARDVSAWIQHLEELVNNF